MKELVVVTSTTTTTATTTATTTTTTANGVTVFVLKEAIKFCLLLRTWLTTIRLKFKLGNIFLKKKKK